jgi:hypothetical protein
MKPGRHPAKLESGDREDHSIMWAALALTAALTAPAQEGDLAIKNVRSTYGIFGQPRKDNKLLPGDLLVVAFDVENLKVKDDGRVLYAMGIELTRKGKPKPEFKREPTDLEAFNTLGGTSMPLFAMSLIGMDAAPGEYTLRVTFKDRGRKKNDTITLDEKFEVVPVKLGFVQVKTTNVQSDPVPLIGVAGQSVWLHCALVGFDVKDKKPNVTFEMQVLDSDGKPTLAQTFKGNITDEPKPITGMMIFNPIPLQLNRAGKFKVVIKATDNLTKKSTDQTLDLTVLK